MLISGCFSSCISILIPSFPFCFYLIQKFANVLQTLEVILTESLNIRGQSILYLEGEKEHVGTMVRYALPARELDFRLQASIVTDRMNAVPGFRTSAAFFTFLRANLVLPSSTQNSTISTPLLDASSSQTLPALGPSSLATMTTIDSCSSSSSEESLYPPSFTLEHPRLSDEVPSLTTTTLHYEDDKVAALKLIADSIAQQRQAASTAVIFHPLVVGAYLLLLCVLCQVLWKTRSDLGVVFTTAAGVTMACLVGVRALTNEYLILAEGINWGYLDNGEEDDLLIGSIFGDEIIGVAVLRLERNGNKKRKMGGKGFVRAWTTKLKYRGKGVATGLLEEVVRVTREKVGNSAEIGFAVEHANSRMVLPEMFNKAFRRNEYRAARALDGVIAEVGIHGKKKR